MKQVKLSYLLAAIFLSINVFGQEKYETMFVNELAENAKPIRTINPLDENYDDLKIIGNHIEDSEIVLLGEGAHSDGSAMSAKTRLLKYLIEEKGFTNVVFEADFFAINFGMTKENRKEFAKENIYTMWSQSEVTKELWNFLQEHPEVSVYGIDPRFAGVFSRENLVKSLRNQLEKCCPQILNEDYKIFEKDLQLMLDNEFRFKANLQKVNFSHLVNVIEEIEACFTYSSNLKNRLWLHQITNLKEVLKYINGDLRRDIIMGGNFIRLRNSFFPNEKTIVWCHNNHAALSPDVYVNMDGKQELRNYWTKKGAANYISYIGAELYREYGNKVYTIGTIGYEGTVSHNFFGNDSFHADFSMTKEKKHPENEMALENLLHKRKLSQFIKGHNFLYTIIPYAIDFKEKLQMGIYPTHILVGKDGLIKDVILGTTKSIDEKLIELINQNIL